MNGGAVQPILHALFGGAHNLLRQFGCPDQPCARSAAGDIFGGAAHVDVDAVKTQFTEQNRRLVEKAGRLAKDLADDRALRLVIEQVAQQLPVAHEQPLDVGELGIHKHGLAILFLQMAIGLVSHAIHRRQGDNWSRECLPKGLCVHSALLYSALASNSTLHAERGDYDRANRLPCHPVTPTLCSQLSQPPRIAYNSTNPAPISTRNHLERRLLYVSSLSRGHYCQWPDCP